MECFGYDRGSGYLFSCDDSLAVAYRGIVGESDLPVSFSSVPIYLSLPRSTPEMCIVASQAGNCRLLEPRQAAVVGSAFLSGYAGGLCLSLWDSTGGNDGLQGMFVRRSRDGVVGVNQLPRVTVGELCGATGTVCLSGGDLTPHRIGEVARMFPMSRFFVSELGDALPAFGALVFAISNGLRVLPARLAFETRRDEPFPWEPRMVFDSAIENDGSGKMAFALAGGEKVVNEMRDGPGLSVFYGRALKAPPVEEECVYLVGSDDGYLVGEPASVALHAPWSAPVEIRCSSAFRDATGHCGDTAVVRFVDQTDGDDIKALFSFYRAFSRKSVIASIYPLRTRYNGDSATVFRGLAAYDVPVDRIMKRYPSDTARAL